MVFPHSEGSNGRVRGVSGAGAINPQGVASPVHDHWSPETNLSVTISNIDFGSIA